MAVELVIEVAVGEPTLGVARIAEVDWLRGLLLAGRVLNIVSDPEPLYS